MPLVKETIKQGFVDACTQVMNDKGDDRQGTLERVAEGYAQTVIDAIKSMTIVYTAGLTSPSGLVTGTFECKIQ